MTRLNRIDINRQGAALVLVIVVVVVLAAVIMAGGDNSGSCSPLCAVIIPGEGKSVEVVSSPTDSWLSVLNNIRRYGIYGTS